MTKGSQGKNIDRIRRISELLSDTSSNDYQLVATQLHEARELFHQHLADRLTQPLNDYLGTQPHDTMRQKQDLSRWVNNELRSFGVAICCGKTHEAASLRADPGHDPAAGRFQLALMSNDLKRRRTLSSPELFLLQLMPHYERREPLAEIWVKKIQRPDESKDRSC